MNGNSGQSKILQRIEKTEEAIARFARMTDEYRTLRKSVAAGAAQERIDDLIKLNEDTAAILRRGLVITEGDLSRAQRTDSDCELLDHP